MKFASYNIEWMNALFRHGKPRLSNDWSARYNITCRDQLDAIAKVLRAVDADAYLILEAPNEYESGATASMLENFSREFGLRQSQALIGASSTTDQEIALLYDPERIGAIYHPHEGPKPPRFTDEYSLKIDEARARKYQFSKPPLELVVTDLEADQRFALIGAHFKTKAPHGARNDQEAHKFGLENRRKQIAQATWLRARIDQIDEPLLVAGDFNDGPGYDVLERKIGQSSLDILTQGGALWDPAIKTPPYSTTARFFNREDHSYKEAQLDFAFVNTKLRPFAHAWEIWHPFQNKRLQLIEDWQEALLTASDHFPVALEIDWHRQENLTAS